MTAIAIGVAHKLLTTDAEQGTGALPTKTNDQ
jgi:hypothetical protein